jgi:hypothetical protein
MQKQLRVRSYHVDNHENHLFFFVGQLNEVDWWQVKIRVHSQHVLVRWQGVQRMVISY